MVSVTQNEIGSDSIRTVVVIKKVDISPFVNASLFIGLAEDTVYVNGGNGELVHYSVLRKSPSQSTGISLTLPSAVGDSIIVSRSALINNFWNRNRIFSLAILQESSTKAVIQTNKSSLLISSLTGMHQIENTNIIKVYPNPTTQYLSVDLAAENDLSYIIYNTQGRLLESGKILKNEPIDLLFEDKGAFFIKIYNEEKQINSVKYFIKQ